MEAARAARRASLAAASAVGRLHAGQAQRKAYLSASSCWRAPREEAGTEVGDGDLLALADRPDRAEREGEGLEVPEVGCVGGAAARSIVA